MIVSGGQCNHGRQGQNARGEQWIGAAQGFPESGAGCGVRSNFQCKSHVMFDMFIDTKEAAQDIEPHHDL